jgi:glutathione S-transferase kappa 1
MTYIKDNYSEEKYEAAFNELWIRLWEQHWDISVPEKMAATLAPLFSQDEVQTILEAANKAEYKQKLNATTKLTLDTGAFGCPWFILTNSEGKREPFFGSDRYASSTQFTLVDKANSWAKIPLHVDVSRRALSGYRDTGEVESIN